MLGCSTTEKPPILPVKPLEHISTVEETTSIAHQALEIEGSNPEAIQKLEDLIATANNKLSSIENTDSRENAKYILTTIGNAITDAGFSNEKEFLLSEGLNKKRLDCDLRTQIYLEIARPKGLDIYAAFAPHHMFLICKINNDIDLFWETLTNSEKTREYYIKQYTISEIAINNGVYLQPLSAAQILAHQIAAIGNTYAFVGDSKNAIRYLDKALELNPKNIVVRCNRGLLLEKPEEKYEEALQDFNIVIALDPYEIEAKFHRATTLLYLKRIDEGLKADKEAKLLYKLLYPDKKKEDTDTPQHNTPNLKENR